jgi:pimeloyl-ACP methyl ester carboxylesterase
LNDFGLTQPIVFAGWSYGGGVILDFLLDHPEWARTVTLIEPQVPWVRPELDAATRQQRDDDLELSREHVSEAELAGFIRRAGLLPEGVEPGEVDGWSLMMRHRQSLRAIPTIWEYPGNPDRLEKLAAPCLLVKGVGSTPNDRAMIDILGRELPQATVIEMPGGHSAHLVSIDSFLEQMSMLQENQN